ncbi:MAG: mannonate dehydratase [Bacteroidota bacterium]
MALEQTWRWYGPNDPITLAEVKQTGATGIVSALSHIPNGEVWTFEEIKKRQEIIAEAGLTWSVIESIPVSEDIKKQSGDYKQHIENYKQSLINVGKCGIETVCYNFMPVLDWSRTDLMHQFEDGSFALMFNPTAFAAFELHILKRKGVEAEYSEEEKKAAKDYYEKLDDSAKFELTKSILGGLPGSEESFSIEDFQTVLDAYAHIDADKLREHLYYFLREVIPVAESAGVRMAIHPDDPPKPLLGLPRIVSNINDAKALCAAVDSPSNGVTLCTGSYGVGVENDLVEMTRELADKIHFIHLRNVSRDESGYFMEDNHMVGDVDMYGVMKELLIEERRRKSEGRADWQMPVRPDHGHLMFDDIKKQKTNPGYSLYGRMRGLAEIRGLEIGVERSLDEK